MTFSETRRQILHIAMGLFALALRFLTWWQAALCALVALLFNMFVLPLVGGSSVYRPADAARGYPLGILLYPIAVLALILAFPARPDVVAAAWGILAFGDGLATLVGRSVGRHPLPWNGDKTAEGTTAFIVCGAIAGSGLAMWAAAAVVPRPPLVFFVLAPLAASIVAAMVETIPVRLDDNISVPVVAGATLWGATLMTRRAIEVSWPIIWHTLPAALLLNVVVAVAGWRARTVRFSGLVVGALVGTAIYATTGPPGWVLLFATFFIAAITSRMGLKRKRVLGIAEEGEGRRGGGNAIANCGVAVFAGILAVTTHWRDLSLLAFAAALAAGGSDTVASEIGKAWGRRTFLVTTWSSVRPGTSGAISIEGTAAGVVGALALAALATSLGLIPGAWIWAVVVGATVGAFVESALGATLEHDGVLNNDMLNLINTAVGAIVAIVIVRAIA